MDKRLNKEYFEANKKLWDAKTPLHISHPFYNMEGFMAGENSLRKIELSELPDLRGLEVFHSQCHFGQDTLSLERMGARCTGIDLSPRAIEEAMRLRDELGLQSDFMACNVYEIDKYVEKQFDLVFTSYGVIAWLPDLDQWAGQLMARLKPGGMFYMAEFHPVLYMFDWSSGKISYDYFNSGEAQMEINQGTYADRDADIEMKEYFWQHSIGEVLNALISQGLRIEHFNEYDFSPYDCFENMTKRADQEYVFKPGEVDLPHVFTIVGRKA